MIIENNADVRALLKRTSDLPPNQRIVVLLYASMAQDANGTVLETGHALAGEIGMTPTLFSRLRGELVRTGWLELSRQVGNSPLYRLTEKAGGQRPTVVPLRRPTTPDGHAQRRA